MNRKAQKAIDRLMKNAANLEAARLAEQIAVEQIRKHGETTAHSVKVLLEVRHPKVMQAVTDNRFLGAVFNSRKFKPLGFVSGIRSHGGVSRVWGKR